MGFGAVSGKLTLLFSLFGPGSLPAPRERNQKHSGAGLEGNLPSLLPFAPKRACLALLRRPLCLPSQIRVQVGSLWWSLRALPCREHRNHTSDAMLCVWFLRLSSCVCLALSLCFRACLCIPGSVHFG